MKLSILTIFLIFAILVVKEVTSKPNGKINNPGLDYGNCIKEAKEEENKVGKQLYFVLALAKEPFKGLFPFKVAPYFLLLFKPPSIVEN